MHDLAKYAAAPLCPGGTQGRRFVKAPPRGREGACIRQWEGWGLGTEGQSITVENKVIHVHTGNFDDSVTGATIHHQVGRSLMFKPRNSLPRCLSNSGGCSILQIELIKARNLIITEINILIEVTTKSTQIELIISSKVLDLSEFSDVIRSRSSSLEGIFPSTTIDIDALSKSNLVITCTTQEGHALSKRHRHITSAVCSIDGGTGSKSARQRQIRVAGHVHGLGALSSELEGTPH